MLRAVNAVQGPLVGAVLQCTAPGGTSESPNALPHVHSTSIARAEGQGALLPPLLLHCHWSLLLVLLLKLLPLLVVASVVAHRMLLLLLCLLLCLLLVLVLVVLVLLVLLLLYPCAGLRCDTAAGYVS